MKSVRAPLAKRGSFVRFRHFPGAGSKTWQPHQEVQSGTSFILSAVVIVLWAVLIGRARPGFQPWWLRSTRPLQVLENATFATAPKNFLAENSDQCCRLLIKF